jgi:sugar lactone lactonase YvrE
MVDGLIVHECHDRLFFRVSGWWWVYQLSTGFELGRLDPKRLMPDSENDRAVWDAQPVAGTPLTLVHWYRTDGEQPATRSPGARFTLVDLKGRTVWSLKLNRDYNLAFKDFRLRRVIHKQGAILCTGQASRFELHFVADAQRVTFSVKPEPTGNWAVAEVAREPLTLSDRILKPPEIPQRPLKSLGTLVLRLKKKRPTSLIRGVLGLVFGARGKLASLTIDRHGRFYAVDGRTAAVHVFDPRGKFLHVCKPACTDVFGVGGNRVISVTDRSEVFLNLDDDRYIRFSAKGARLGSKRLKTDRWYSLPGTTNGLALGYREAYFVDAEGKTIRTIRRGADGNWLIYPDCAAVAPNGSFAIVAASGTVTNVNGRTVHLYDATGNPIRSTPLHASLCYYTDIAFDGTHLVVCGPEADRDEAAERVLVMDAAGSPLISFIPESSEQTSWQPYLLPNGRELVLFDGESGALQRYALP